MNNKDKIILSVVSHNNIDEVILLLNSLKEINYSYIKCIIITINTSEDLTKFNNIDYPFKIKIIKNSNIKGFGANHNYAFSLYNSIFFLIINPDIIFPKTFDFKPLIEKLMYKKNNAVISPRIYEKGKVSYPRKFPNINDYLFNKKKYDNNNFWISGCFMLFKSNIFKIFNGFDCNYFMYMEDVDLCKRLSDNNLKIIMCDDQYIFHNAKRKSKKNFIFFFYHLRSLIYYFKKKY